MIDCEREPLENWERERESVCVKKKETIRTFTANSWEEREGEREEKANGSYEEEKRETMSSSSLLSVDILRPLSS